jgi:hypothetical protein
VIPASQPRYRVHEGISSGSSADIVTDVLDTDLVLTDVWGTDGDGWHRVLTIPIGANGAWSFNITCAWHADTAEARPELRVRCIDPAVTFSGGNHPTYPIAAITHPTHASTTGGTPARVFTGHGAPTTLPDGAAAGDVYVDLDSGNFYAYDGTEPAGGNSAPRSLFTGHGAPVTLPVGAEAGDLYIDLDTADVYEFDGTEAPATGVTDSVFQCTGTVAYAPSATSALVLQARGLETTETDTATIAAGYTSGWALRTGTA